MAWVFTDNFTAEDDGFQPGDERAYATRRWTELPSGVRYIVWQHERVTHDHIQGYLELKRGRYLSWLKNHISPTAHFEVRLGTQAQAIAYVKKQDSRVAGPWELGERSLGQGSRVDLAGFKDNVREGLKRRRAVDEYPGIMAKYPRFYDTIRMTQRPDRVNDLTVWLFFGPTGTGKTRTVHEGWGEGDYYEVPCSNGTRWFDGYDGESKVLIDDFAGRASHMTLTMTLKLLDRYPILLPVKGGFVWWMPDHVVVTTNIHPRDWYNFERRSEQYRALRRRFTRVVDFTKGATNIGCNDGSEVMERGPEFWWDCILDPKPNLYCHETLPSAPLSSLDLDLTDTTEEIIDLTGDDEE